MKIIKRYLKKAHGKYRKYSYYRYYKQEAYDLIKAMSRASNTPDTSAMFKKCDEYAHDVLGSLEYSPWLKAYSVLAGTFKEGWIPDNYYGEIVVPYLKGDYGRMSFCNAISGRIFDTDLIPDLAYSVNGLLYTTSMELIKVVNLKRYLFENCEKVVYKLDNGLQGKSVFVYDENNFPEDTLTFANGVFQSYIIQHPFFDEFCGNGTSTIRLTTVVDDELNIQCRGAYLRIPRRADTHVKSSTAIRVPIEAETGGLSEKGYLPDWIPIKQHPDSEKAFLHQVIPSFQKCIETAISTHRKLPFPRVIGWDLIVDSMEKPVIMEWNGYHNNIKFSEAAMGPCFADLGWQELWKVKNA
jgi:hypothetical protein